jgi:cytochrome c556
MTLRHACIAFGFALLFAGTAGAQDQSIATPKDAIFARKILMSSIGENMDAISTVLQSAKPLDLVDVREHADTISVMLMAFPHLFPASTNQWQPNVERDPGTDTFAAPEVWRDYASFYKRATEASKLAYLASRALEEPAYRAYIPQLQAACDGCHAQFLKTD